MEASSGTRSAFLLLHRRQELTTLVQMSFPPLGRGASHDPEKADEPQTFLRNTNTCFDHGEKGIYSQVVGGRIRYAFCHHMRRYSVTLKLIVPPDG